MNVKKFSRDFFYTCGAHAIINAIQHLFVFPWINKVSGPETAGRILACLSIVYIFSTTFGVGITSVRLVQDRKGTGRNGDYLCIMGIGSILLIFVAILAKHFDFDPQVNLFWFVLLSILNMIRIYGEVDFRENLHFSKYFVYYVLITIGYSIGVFVYKLTGNWTHIFLVGELLAIIMLIFRKMVFLPSLPSDKFLFLTKAVFLIYLSTIMVQIVTSGDRLIIKYFLDDRTVTVYSSLSLAAKMANMVIFPLGTLLLSYLTAKTIPHTKKWFFKVSASWIGLCLCALAGTLIVAPIYVKLFYPNLYEDIAGLNLIVNLGLVMAMIGFLFRTYLIAISNATVVFLFELVFTIVHLSLALLLTYKHGMIGYAWAVIIGRGSRMIFGAFLTLFYVNKAERASGQ
ncbi:hypothetical protein J6U78_02950 [bacterium]|nr:hypothetical protein [bacterium]